MINENNELFDLNFEVEIIIPSDFLMYKIFNRVVYIFTFSQV